MWTPLLASSLSLERPIGAPRVFFNLKYLFSNAVGVLSVNTVTSVMIWWRFVAMDVHKFEQDHK